ALAAPSCVVNAGSTKTTRCTGSFDGDRLPGSADVFHTDGTYDATDLLVPVGTPGGLKSGTMPRAEPEAVSYLSKVCEHSVGRVVPLRSASGPHAAQEPSCLKGVWRECTC